MQETLHDNWQAAIMRLVNRQFVSLLQAKQLLPPRTTGEKMKTFKAICAASVLALSLTIPTYADGNPGDGHGPGRTTSKPADYEPSAGTGSSIDGSTSDASFLTMADIIWALATIY